MSDVQDSRRAAWWTNYWNDNQTLLDESYLRNDGVCYINWATMQELAPDLSEDFLESPRKCLHYADLSAKETQTIDGKPPRFTYRVNNLPRTHLISPKDVRSEHIFKARAIQCIIKKATNVYPRLMEACFECVFCATKEYVEQVDWEFQKTPTACSSCQKAGPWELREEESTYLDEQKWLLADDPSSVEPGGQPQEIQCIVKGDQVNSAQAGESVIVNGVIIAVPKREGARKKHENKLFLLQNSVERLEATHSHITWTSAEEKEFIEFSGNHNPLIELAGNFATNIQGMNLVKESLVLSIVGGVEQVDANGNRERGDIHVLMAGDPGSGKSALMDAIPKFTPRCVFASGEGATAAGLTATVSKSEFGDGSWMLEVGAMGLANGGTLALDEMDKMSKTNMGAMHLGMEQQRIEVHKATVHGTIHTKCNVIAACNPKHGAFDLHESEIDQIELPKPMFSRFDLIFVLSGRQTKEQVELITDKILGLGGEESFVKLEYDWIRKYIAYAKTFNPVLSREAAKKLKEFFVAFKTNPNAEGVNYRALHAIRRLAQANARLRLSDEASLHDAELAIGLYQNWARQIGFDESTGKYDITPADGGLKKEVRDVFSVIRGVVREFKEGNGEWPNETEILECLIKSGMESKKARDGVDSMSKAGDLLESGGGKLRIVGSLLGN